MKNKLYDKLIKFSDKEWELEIIDKILQPKNYLWKND